MWCFKRLIDFKRYPTKEILCVRGNGQVEMQRLMASTARQRNRDPNKRSSARAAKEFCGQINLAKMVKPLIGPVLKQVHREIIVDNKYFLFDLAKNICSNLVFGFMNFFYDSIKYILTKTWNSKWSDLKKIEIGISLKLSHIIFVYNICSIRDFILDIFETFLR